MTVIRPWIWVRLTFAAMVKLFGKCCRYLSSGEAIDNLRISPEIGQFRGNMMTESRHAFPSGKNDGIRLGVYLAFTHPDGTALVANQRQVVHQRVENKLQRRID